MSADWWSCGITQVVFAWLLEWNVVPLVFLICCIYMNIPKLSAMPVIMTSPKIRSLFMFVINISNKDAHVGVTFIGLVIAFMKPFADMIVWSSFQILVETNKFKFTSPPKIMSWLWALSYARKLSINERALCTSWRWFITNREHCAPAAQSKDLIISSYGSEFINDFTFNMILYKNTNATSLLFSTMAKKGLVSRKLKGAWLFCIPSFCKH